MIKPINKIDNIIQLFIDKIITEKNLSKATILAYQNDLRHFAEFLSRKKKNFLNLSEEDFLNWNKDLIKKKYKSN